jgi:hypothetical protein
MAIAMKTADEKFDEAMAVLDRTLEQAQREFGPDDPKTANYLSLRVDALRRLGDLTRAGSTAEELLAARSKKLRPEEPGALEALASLADIRRHQGANMEAGKLFAQLRDAAQRALDASKKEQPGAEPNKSLTGEIMWAERLAHTLAQSGWSDRSRFPPGQPGGPSRIDAPFQLTPPIADGRIEPGEYGDGKGYSFDFAKDPNAAGSYLAIDETLIPQRVKDLSDLSVQMHAVHTSQALFLAFRVRDQSVRAQPGNPPWENDCIEVYLDGDRVANDWTPAVGFGGNREAVHLTADALGNPGDPRWKVGASRIEDGYLIEFAIPLDVIDTQDGPGFRPAASGAELRFNVDLLDYDDPPGNKPAYALLWCEDRHNWSLAHGGEDFWSASLRLTPARVPEALSTNLPADVFASPRANGR